MTYQYRNDGSYSKFASLLGVFSSNIPHNLNHHPLVTGMEFMILSKSRAQNHPNFQLSSKLKYLKEKTFFVFVPYHNSFDFSESLLQISNMNSAHTFKRSLTTKNETAKFILQILISTIP